MPLGRAYRAEFRDRTATTLADGLNGRQNSFGVLRLILASMVIFSHAFPLGGWGTDPAVAWTHGQESIGGIAVVGFFAISGFLIAKSGATTDLLQFLWRRTLRIFPAFWVVLLVAAVVVGPIVWLSAGRSLTSYATGSPNGPWAYLIGNADLSINHYGIHDIFSDTTPYGVLLGGSSVLNGSVWTLVYEFRCYLIIAVFVALGILRRARVIVLLSLVGVYVLAILDQTFPDLLVSISPHLADSENFRLSLIFLIGSSMAVYSHRIVLSDKIAVFAAVLAVATLFTFQWMLAGYPAYAYLLLWAAVRLPEAVQGIGAKSDYSYGMYIYGFLVQQITAHWGWHELGYWPWVFATILITAGCAWLSWHGVEKRALALKSWGPGLGFRYWLRGRASGAASGSA